MGGGRGRRGGEGFGEKEEMDLLPQCTVGRTGRRPEDVVALGGCPVRARDQNSYYCYRCVYVRVFMFLYCCISQGMRLN